MALLDFLLGRTLATSEERAEHIGPAKGIPVFGLDALGSAAYGPEAALTLLIPLGLAGLNFIVLPVAQRNLLYTFHLLKKNNMLPRQRIHNLLKPVTLRRNLGPHLIHAHLVFRANGNTGVFLPKFE